MDAADRKVTVREVPVIASWRSPLQRSQAAHSVYIMSIYIYNLQSSLTRQKSKSDIRFETELIQKIEVEGITIEILSELRFGT